MKAIELIVCISLLFCLASCERKVGGECVYLPFEEDEQVKAVNADEIVLTGRFITKIPTRYLEHSPEVGDFLQVTGEKIVTGACVPVKINSVTVVKQTK